MNRLKQHIVRIAILCAALSVADRLVGQAEAADQADASLDWLDANYPYFAVDQALPETLRELGHNLDVAVDVSPGIKDPFVIMVTKEPSVNS